MRKLILATLFALSFALPALAQGVPIASACNIRYTQGHAENLSHQDGWPVVECGAIKFLLDDYGTAISDGYHQFYRLSNNMWVGRIGGMVYLLRGGRAISNKYHEIISNSDGTYTATLGAYTFHLNRDGQVIN